VAGEASGDQLGAELISALRQQFPGAQFMGVGGERMSAAGMQCWKSSNELAVMGLFEVLAHLPRLLRLRRWLLERLTAERPDLLVGIDSPDFNLGLERRVRAAGIPAVHYVSPTVWAWRQGRVRKIARSTDMVLCLFPFEPEFYAAHGVPARYTGHPLADVIPEQQDRAGAREQLGLQADRQCVALLPGSRGGEVSRLAGPLVAAAARLQARYPGMQFVAPMAGAEQRALFETRLAAHPDVEITLLDGQARKAMAAADVVVCASGTAALETMLVNRPMVVVYRFSWPTYLAGKGLRLLKSRFFSLPNILAGKPLVPELLQHEVNPRRVTREVSRWIDDPAAARILSEEFASLHRGLRRDAARSAAECIREQLADRLQ
jgi:lipid-A-disaccharide synthase